MSFGGQSYAQGFFTPEDVATEQGLRRRQAYAQALLQGDTPQGAYGGLASAGNKILGAFLSKQADSKEADLSKSAQESYAKNIAAFLGGGDNPQPVTPPTSVSNAVGSGPQMNAAPIPGGDASGMEGPSAAPAPIPNATGPAPMPQAIPNAQGQAPAPTPMQAPQAGSQQSAMARLLATGDPRLIQQFAPKLFEHQMTIDDNRVTPLSTADNAAFIQANNLPPGLYGRDVSGNIKPVVQSDMKSEGAIGQAIRQHQQEQLLTPEAFAQKKTLTSLEQAPQWANINLAKQRIEMQRSGLFDPDTIGFMADQVLSGDKSPFTNLGRGVQGAQNIAALRQEVFRRAQSRGLKGSDLAALNAEFSGLQAGERTLGTRTANVEMAASETQQLAPLAIAASNAVNRSQYPSLNKVQLAVQQGTGDENVVRLNQSVNALVNTYSRAISPTGTPTVSDKEHAREILESAYSKGQFSAAIDQMQKEIAAARRSPASVRGEFRSAISGHGAGIAAVPDAPGKIGSGPANNHPPPPPGFVVH